jgi:hypothetical protein
MRRDRDAFLVLTHLLQDRGGGQADSVWPADQDERERCQPRGFGVVQEMGIRELMASHDMIDDIVGREETAQHVVVREKDIRRKALFLRLDQSGICKLATNKIKTMEYVDNRFNDTILLT